MIPEPQRTYVLELIAALGPAANDFILAGAQAIKFTVTGARGTKDVDFLLNVTALREEPLQLATILGNLGYQPIEGARNFQFEKPIPNSSETMRIEFMAPEEYKRRTDFRVDVQKGVHARACVGGSIAVAESNLHPLDGKLPAGENFSAQVRVTKPHALVMLKALALADRYDNIRGAREARHDREEAQTHAADIVAILTAQTNAIEFTVNFVNQFRSDPELGIRVLRILRGFFRDAGAPGLIVYMEHLAAKAPADRHTQDAFRHEVDRAQRLVSTVLPPSAFFAVAAAIDDCCNWNRLPALVEAFFSGLESARIPVTDDLALQFLPSSAFGRAFNSGDILLGNASEALQGVAMEQRCLLRGYLTITSSSLRTIEALYSKFPYTLRD
jgi:hypothetical protein